MYRKIKVKNRYIEGWRIPLFKKNLIVLRGSKGYVMCGYLNMKVANKFGDVAVKVIGVTTIENTLQTTVFACTRAAKRLGIFKGQKVKEVVKIIA